LTGIWSHSPILCYTAWMLVDQAIIRSTILVSFDIWALMLLIRKQTVRYLDCVALFLCLHILINVVLTPLGYSHRGTDLYAYTYDALFGALYGASFYMVWCLWRIGLEKYPGFQRFGIIVLAASILALLLFVNFIVSHSPGVTSQDNWINMWFVMLGRCMSFVVAGVLLMFLLLLSIFRIEVSRTVRNLAGSLFVYSIVRALLQTWVNHYQKPGGEVYLWVWSMSTGLMVFSWAMTIRRHRAEDPGEIPPLFGPGQSREDVELQAQAVSRRLSRLLG
jgi:hypothetical protein